MKKIHLIIIYIWLILLTLGLIAVIGWNLEEFTIIYTMLNYVLT